MTKDKALKLALEPFDHQQAASTALRESMNRSVVIAKNTVPTLQKRPPNCGTGYCSCVECVMEPAAQPAPTVQEPVAIHCKAKRENNGVCPNHNLHCGWPKCNNTTPPAAQRQWVGLTEMDIAAFGLTVAKAKAVEAFLKKKNT